VNKEKVRSSIVKAVVEAVTNGLDVSEIARAMNGATRRSRSRTSKRVVKRKSPKPDSNIGRIYDYLLRHANTNVASRRLEKLLLARREEGERLSGDAASVCSDINYLRKYYGLDIEIVRVGVYRLHSPKRR